jgi:hypothetical protein
MKKVLQGLRMQIRITYHVFQNVHLLFCTPKVVSLMLISNLYTQISPVLRYFWPRSSNWEIYENAYRNFIRIFENWGHIVDGRMHEYLMFTLWKGGVNRKVVFCVKLNLKSTLNFNSNSQLATLPTQVFERGPDERRGRHIWVGGGGATNYSAERPSAVEDRSERKWGVLYNSQWQQLLLNKHHTMKRIDGVRRRLARRLLRLRILIFTTLKLKSSTLRWFWMPGGHIWYH